MNNFKEIVLHNVMSTQIASRYRYKHNDFSHNGSIVSSENDDNFVRENNRDREASDATSNADSFVNNGLPVCEYFRDSGKFISIFFLNHVWPFNYLFSLLEPGQSLSKHD